MTALTVYKRRGMDIAHFASKRAKVGGPRMRMAMALGKYAWKNRRNISARVRQFSRGVRGANRIVRQARAKVGEQIGSTSAQRIIQVNNQFDMGSRSLLFARLHEIAEQGAGNQDRRRDTINCRGYLIQLCITNKVEAIIYFNWAVIAPKDRDNDIVNANFFRGYEVRRGENFNPNNLSVIDFHKRPINTDLYNVLAHNRIRLGQNPPDGQAVSDTNFRLIKKWVPLRRQIRFDTLVDEIALDQVYVVYWCDFNQSPIGTAAQANVIDVIQNHVTYFRNTVH